MVILISYDLNKYERPEAYQMVKNTIEENAISSKKPLYSQWFVETEESIASWHNRMKEITDENDSWFIIKVQSPYQGWFSSGIWDWLNERI